MISERELIDLGEQFGIDIGETEAENLWEEVESAVAELDLIDDLPVGGADDLGERSWEPPFDDLHNALTVPAMSLPQTTAYSITSMSA